MKGFKKLKGYIRKAMPYLAWVSFALALTGGSLLPGTDFGKGIADFIRSWGWDWFAPVVFTLACAGLAIDTGRDLIPNRVAVYAAAVAPTLASAIGGLLAEWVRGLAEWVASWSTRPLIRLTDIHQPAGIAIVALGLAFVIASRVTKPGRKAKAGYDVEEMD